MKTDLRYKGVKAMIESEDIKKLNDIFNYIPKTVVCKDLGMNAIKFNSLIKDPSDFKLEEIYRLAGLINCNRKKLLDIIHPTAEKAFVKFSRDEP